MLRADLEADRTQEAEPIIAVPAVAAPMPDAGDTLAPADDPIRPNVPSPAHRPDLEPTPRLYADRVVPGADLIASSDYRVADLESRHHLDPDRFHDPAYADILVAMIADVLAAEAPLFEDVLIRRVARAHGFTRAGSRIRDAVLAGVPRHVARTEEDDRTVLWPPGEEPRDVVAHRRGDPGLRSHADTPLAELAGLARHLAPRARGADLVRLMASELGLSRIEAGTRARLERAVTAAGF